jgi:hypothetical protein
LLFLEMLNITQAVSQAAGDTGCYSLYLEILDVIQKTWNIRAIVNEDAECIIRRKV